MTDHRKEALSVLEKHAAAAARHVAGLLRTGAQSKKSAADEAAYEILDRVGLAKKSETTIKHEGLPELAPAVIAGALSSLAQMFGATQQLKEAACQYTTDLVEDGDDLTATGDHKIRGEGEERKQIESTPAEPDPDEIQFTVNKEILTDAEVYL